MLCIMRSSPVAVHRRMTPDGLVLRRSNSTRTGAVGSQTTTMRMARLMIAPDALQASWSLDDPMETRGMGRIPRILATSLAALAPPGSVLRPHGRIRTELIFGTAVVWMGLYFAIRIPMVFIRAGSIIRGRHKERVGLIRTRKEDARNATTTSPASTAAECPECGTLLW